MGRPKAAIVQAHPTRERILNSAERLFAEKGHAGVGLREIAREAGVSAPTLLYYYGSKDGLYSAIVERAFAAVGQLLMSTLALEIEPSQKVVLLLSRYADWLEAHPDVLRLITRAQLDQPAYMREWARRHGAPLVGGLMQFLDEGKLKGLLARSDAVNLTLELGCAVSHFFLYHNSIFAIIGDSDEASQRERTERFKSHLLHVALRALTPPRETDGERG